jgi:hypothetical protein
MSIYREFLLKVAQIHVFMLQQLRFLFRLLICLVQIDSCLRRNDVGGGGSFEIGEIVGLFTSCTSEIVGL